jgi:hypothetical protein
MSSPAPSKLPGTAEAVPSRLGTFFFGLKAWLLRVHRGCHNLVSPIRRHEPAAANLPMQVAESRTPLWTTESLVERSLQLGKVQNLRIAARALHGVVIPKEGLRLRTGTA